MALFSLTRPLCAEEEPASNAAMIWDAGPHAYECLSAERLRRDVEANLGRSVFDQSKPAEVVVRLTIRRTERPRGWLATIRSEDSRGRLWGVRELRTEAPSCHALDDKLVVVTALMVDSALMTPVSEEEAALPEQTELLDERQRPDDSALDPTPRPPRPKRVLRPWELSIEASAASALGLLPRAAFGVALGLELRFPWFGGVRLGGSAFLRQREPMLPRGETRFRTATLALLLCPVTSSRGRVRASVCAGIDGLETRAESIGILEHRLTRRFTPRSGFSFRAAGVLAGRWFLGGGADLAVPWKRDSFLYEDGAGHKQILFRSAPFSLSVLAGGGVLLH